MRVSDNMIQELIMLKGVAASNKQDLGIMISNGKAIAVGNTCTVSISIGTLENAEFVIPQKAIELLSKMTGEKEIESDSKSITIKNKRSKSHFQTITPESFKLNMLPEPQQKGDVCEINTADFADAVKNVSYTAMSENSSSREIMKGISLDADGASLNMAACDGFRVAWCKLKATNNFSAVIIKSAAELASKLIADDKLKIYQSTNQMIIESDSCRIQSQILSGDYFNYKSTFPKEMTNTFTVDRKALLDILSRCRICFTDSKEAVKLSVCENILTLNMSNSVNNFEETIDIEGCGAPLTIGMNLNYITEALKAARGDIVTVGYSTEVKPLIINEESGTKHLILPVRLKGQKNA